MSIKLSAMYGAYWAKKLTPSDYKGTSSWTGNRVLKYKGICRYELWPDEIEPILTEEQIKVAESDAYSRRSAFYQRCYSIDDIKMALINNGPVSLSFMMYTSFYESYGDGQVPMPTSGEHWLGIHAVAIIGYSDKSKKFTFVNSWGETYGDDGLGYIPYEYIEKESVEICLDITVQQFLNNSISGENEMFKFNDETYRFFIGISREYTITHPNILFIDLYNSRNELLGWLIASKVDSDTSEIIDFFIWPDNRNKGYGELILNRYLTYERSYGIKHIIGWLSLEDTRDVGWREATKFFVKRHFKYEHNPDAFAWSPGKINIIIRS